MLQSDEAKASVTAIVKRRKLDVDGWVWEKVVLRIDCGWLAVNEATPLPVQHASLWGTTSSAPRGFEVCMNSGDSISYIAETSAAAQACVDAANGLAPTVPKNKISEVHELPHQTLQKNLPQLNSQDRSLEPSHKVDRTTQTDEDEVGRRLAALALLHTTEAKQCADRRQDAERIRRLEHDQERLRNSLRKALAQSAATSHGTTNNASLTSDQKQISDLRSHLHTAEKRATTAEASLAHYCRREQELSSRLEIAYDELEHLENTAHRLQREQQTLIAALEYHDSLIHNTRKPLAERQLRTSHHLSKTRSASLYMNKLKNKKKSSLSSLSSLPAAPTPPELTHGTRKQAPQRIRRRPPS